MVSSAGLFAAAAFSLVARVCADDLAVSVSTLDFKNRFVESGIVPEVIAALDPAVSFYASYRADDGHTELLAPGAELTLAEAQAPLEFSVENLRNASNITATTRYLIYLLDADAPARNNPSARNLRHFLAGNYTVSTANSTVLTTAQQLVVANANFRPFTMFTPPNPAANTGTHRFIYALYTQPPRFNTAGFESVGMEAETANWNLSRWRTQLGLGPAIGATFFTINTDVNGGRGNASSVPEGMASGIAASPLLALLSTVVAVVGFLTIA